MLPTVAIPRFQGAPSATLEKYGGIADGALLDEVHSLARELRGLRVCHLNSTGFGGGVAELLAREVPLYRSLGILADWRVLLGNPEFFSITKTLHNALQGAPAGLTESDREHYLSVNRRSADLLDTAYDVFVVHDPQPAAFRNLAGERDAKWIWRCHIDTSRPNPDVAGFLLPFLHQYDAAVFTTREFVLPGMSPDRVRIFPPAIDPFSTKNMDLPDWVARAAVANCGLDPSRPLVLQVSRFDPWKDPHGVICAYKQARERVPGLQLALIGSMAGDDPEGWRLLSDLEEESADDPDIHVLTNLSGVGNMEVNAFQRAADLVVQKSLREGFGLVVSESFWKFKPMVCGRAGGIPMQFPSGFGEYLVGSVEECASRMADLLLHPARAKAFGLAAREHVRRKFLLPRLVRDELRLFKEVLGNGQLAGASFAHKKDGLA